MADDAFFRFAALAVPVERDVEAAVPVVRVLRRVLLALPVTAMGAFTLDAAAFDFRGLF